MKKTRSRLLAAALLLCSLLGLASVALTEAPAAGSLKAVQQTIRGNSSWTPESYPEIWITPIFAEYIIDGNERYPAHFLRFAPPEGTAPLRIDYDYANVIDFDTLLQYSYQAFSRMSFEKFLERAEEGDLLADGSDGVALYVLADNRRGRAMIDLEAYFGDAAMLSIEIYDHTGDLSGAELGALIQGEAARVQGALQFEALDHYWTQGVFSSVALYDGYEKVSVTVDTSGMTLIGLQDDKLTSRALVDGDGRTTEISLGSLLWEDEVEDKALADGTPYKLRITEYSSHAFFKLAGKNRDVYLCIKIETPPEGFAAELEAVYPLITLPKAE